MLGEDEQGRDAVLVPSVLRQMLQLPFVPEASQTVQAAQEVDRASSTKLNTKIIM